MENVIREFAPTNVHIIFINQWWESFCFHAFWQSVFSILRNLVYKESAGKQNLARRHWKNTFFQPAKCCHWQLLSHYMQTMCESTAQSLFPPFCLVNPHGGVAYISRWRFLAMLFSSTKQVSDFYQRDIFMSSKKKKKTTNPIPNQQTKTKQTKKPTNQTKTIKKPT